MFLRVTPQLLADGGPAPGESTPSSNQASKPARVPRPRKEDKQPDPRDAYREWYAGYMSAAQGGDEGVESQTMPQQQKRREKGAKRVNPETRKHILESVVSVCVSSQCISARLTVVLSAVIPHLPFARP